VAARARPPGPGPAEPRITSRSVAAVRARGITKRFQTTVALDGVDLAVSEGEVRGLLGPNGAGKTTLLRILFGLVRPDAGSVELFGSLRRDSEHPQLDGVAGFVEDPSFYPYLSGRANLELLARLDGDGGSGRVEEVLERVDLARRAGDRLNGYSTGMRQRLGIAAALLRAPRLLLLDEPTAGLDPAGVREVGELVRRLAGQEVAILVSSHQIAEVEDVCDSFTFLRRGQVVWDGTATELRAQAPASSYGLSTSDDARASELAARHDGVRAEPAGAGGGGLTLTAEAGSLDPYVLALGRAGVAVRRLELQVSPLESMFFKLTGESG
jgi:ABC-2 type transport system ATP-binding protein